MRDNQKTKVLKAMSGFRHPMDRRFHNTDEMIDYVSALMTKDWFINAFGAIREITLAPPRGGGCYAYRVNDAILVKVPQRAQTLIFLLRLLAHSLTPQGRPFHGPEFCAIYLYLVKNVMGDGACGRVIGEFTFQSVDFRPNRAMYDVRGQIVYMRLTGRLR